MVATTMKSRSGIVTPEAVILDFETAGLASRLLAATLDAVIQLVILFGALFAFFSLGELGVDFGGIGIALLYVLLFLLVFGYPAGFETLWRGRTPGKAALGLRVVTAEGAPVRFRHAAIRAMLGLLDKFVLYGVVGVITMLATQRNQRLGDLVAGTIVLRERSGVKAPSAVVFEPPRGLGDYVASLDVSGLGHADYGAIRSFLIRAASLTPEARVSLAAELATPLVSRLRTTPPAGVPAEVFLACVAAAFQQRNGGPPAARPVYSSVWADPPAPGHDAVAPAVASPPPAGPAAGDHGSGFVTPG